MPYIEQQKKGKKVYHYLTTTVRLGSKFKKARVLLSDNKVSKKELIRLSKRKKSLLTTLVEKAKNNAEFFSTTVDPTKVKQRFWVWERPCHVHIMHYLAATLVVPLAKNFGYGYPPTYGFFNGNMGKWVSDMKGMIRSGISIINTLIIKENFGTFDKNWKEVSKKLTDTCNKIENIHLKIPKLSDTVFLKLHEEFHNALFNWWAFANVAELMTYAAEYLMQDVIDKKQFPITTIPIEKSYTIKEEEELMEIVLKIMANKYYRKLFAEDVELINRKLNSLTAYTKLNKLISGHTKKYYWLQNNFYETKVLTEKFFIQQIKDILDSEIKPERFKKINNQKLFLGKQEKDKLINKLKLNTSYVKLIKLLDYFCVFQDDRKHIALKSMHYFDLFLQEIRLRTGVSRDLLNSSSPYEIQSILEKMFDINVLKQRSKYCAMVVDKSSTRVFICEEALKIERALLGSKDSGSVNNISEFEGMRAQGGKVVGRVVKILDPRQSDELKTGDILVTTMTSPDFVPLMKKAKAIITDEGGITCHAAIVARELNKPCVIGTKIATDVLNTGDIVEVNANHGLVKIIERV